MDVGGCFLADDGGIECDCDPSKRRDYLHTEQAVVAFL